MTNIKKSKTDAENWVSTKGNELSSENKINTLTKENELSIIKETNEKNESSAYPNKGPINENLVTQTRFNSLKKKVD